MRVFNTLFEFRIKYNPMRVEPDSENPGSVRVRAGSGFSCHP